MRINTNFRCVQNTIKSLGGGEETMSQDVVNANIMTTRPSQLAIGGYDRPAKVGTKTMIARPVSMLLLPRHVLHIHLVMMAHLRVSVTKRGGRTLYTTFGVLMQLLMPWTD